MNHILFSILPPLKNSEDIYNNKQNKYETRPIPSKKSNGTLPKKNRKCRPTLSLLLKSSNMRMQDIHKEVEKFELSNDSQKLF